MTDKPDGKIRWVRKDAFVMPVLPKSLKIDPIVASLLHVAAFLELSGDNTIDPDWAVEAMEHVGYYLQQMPPKQVESLRRQATQVAKLAKKDKWGKDAIEFFSEFLENLGVGEEEE